jgi:hypothetical protein
MVTNTRKSIIILLLLIQSSVKSSYGMMATFTISFYRTISCGGFDDTDLFSAITIDPLDTQLLAYIMLPTGSYKNVYQKKIRTTNDYMSGSDLVVGQKIANTGLNFYDKQTGRYGFLTGDSSGEIVYYKSLHVSPTTMT